VPPAAEAEAGGVDDEAEDEQKQLGHHATPSYETLAAAAAEAGGANAAAAAGPEVVLGRFEVNAFRVGERNAAFRGIWSAMGLVEGGPEHVRILRQGVTEIEREFREQGRDDEDWKPDDGFRSDWARFEYVECRRAGKKVQENGAIRDDRHVGKTLASFMEDRNVEIAGLAEAHVLALRLYTSNSYGRINGPLRDGCSAESPHPFPATTFFISDGLKKFRAVASELCEPGAQDADMVSWRGMAAMRVPPEVMRDSGTELACCSTSMSKAEATKWARKKGVAPLLLKVKARGCACWGIDMAWLSMYPGEQELLFPPLTYLKFKSMEKEGDVTVVTVEPDWPT
jgi:hypothetical protein